MVVGARSKDDRERGRLVAAVEGWRAKAQSLAADNKRLVAELAICKARAIDLEGQLDAAIEKIVTRSKLCFGLSLEKKPKEPETAPANAFGEWADPGRPSDEGRRRRGQEPGGTGHGRRDYSALETEEVLHDVGDDERRCPDCGGSL